MVMLLGSVNELGPVFVWSLILVGIILGALVGVVWLRRKVMGGQDINGGAGFSLSALREIHRKGQMSAEEFEKAKALLLGDKQGEKRGEDRR